MGLGRQVVSSSGCVSLDDADQVGGIRQIAVMENEISLVDVWVLINVIDTPRVEKLELRRLMP